MINVMHGGGVHSDVQALHERSRWHALLGMQTGTDHVQPHMEDGHGNGNIDHDG